jgi:hypothetical protein
VEARQREKQELQEKSKARVKNWPNTITALRQKREHDKLKRLEDEEVSFILVFSNRWFCKIERRRIDAIEDEMRAEQRRQAIENANKHMHDNQDQVKAFHSKMRLADVL